MDLYFDNAATTPLLTEVKAVIAQRLELYGNPSSLHHLGVEAEKVLSASRRQILKDAGWTKGQIVFTGAGTEANNLAVFGVCRRLAKPGHIVTTAIEHPSVLEPISRLEREGWNVSYIRPNSKGEITAEAVLDAVTKDTVLVSVMHVNNETGDILPVRDIAAGLKNFPRVRFHVDGIQAFGKLTETPGSVGADLYSISGHKLGAPKGIGALLMKSGVTLNPILYGGGQEQGLRSGTENVTWIAALAEASRLAALELPQSYEHVLALSQTLRRELAQIAGCVVDDREAPQSPYIVNAAFPGLKGEVLVHAFEDAGLYVSTGSACSTKGGHSQPSHVLTAFSKPAPYLGASLRFSLARWQTADQVTAALAVVREKAAWLREVMA